MTEKNEHKNFVLGILQARLRDLAVAITNVKHESTLEMLVRELDGIKKRIEEVEEFEL